MSISYAPCIRHGYLFFPVQVSRGQRVTFHHLLRCSGKYHLAPQAPGLRAHIHDIIRIQHHILVVLHHNDRVAQIAQLLQRVYQPYIIALMQSDTRFIQYIKHIHQLAPYLRSQADTLTLASGQRSRRAAQRQIIQSHIQQESQTRTNLLQDFRRDTVLLLVHLSIQIIYPILQFRDIHSRQFGNVLSRYAIMQRFLVQPLPMALRTRCGTDKLVRPFLSRCRSLHLLLHHDILGNPLVRKHILRETNLFIVDRQTLVRTVHDIIHHLFRDILYRCLQRKSRFLANGLYL